MVFFSSHVQMWELDQNEGWKPKNWCFWTVALEKTLESPLDYREIKPVNPKGNRPWILFGRTDAEAEAPIFWSPDANSWLTEKDPDAGKDWRQEKAMTEDEMAGGHHWFNRYEFEQTLGDGEGQGNLTCCSPWGCKKLGMTWILNNNNNIFDEHRCKKSQENINEPNPTTHKKDNKPWLTWIHPRIKSMVHNI